MLRMHSFPTYLKINAAILLCGLAVLFLGNLIVDPEGRFSLVDISGFNHEKTEAMETGGRAVKALALQQRDNNAVILGSSRSENGLDPRYPAFGALRVYNASLEDTNLYEIYKVFTFARKTHRLQAIVLGLDFLLFTNKRTVGGDFLHSGFAETSSWLSNLQYLASFQTLLSSFATVQNNRKGEKSLYTDQGMRDRTLFSDGAQVNHRNLFISVLTRNYLVREETYGGFSYGHDRLELLRSLVEQCRTDGIALYLFITPAHARDLEALQALGLYPLFEQWKRDLVSILAADAVQHPREQPIRLWDFTGYTTLTTEDVPSAAEKGKSMRWYWESSHFKKELGDLVLDRLFNYHDSRRSVPEDFGVPITAENIETHLAWLREQQKRYSETHPQEVAEVEYLAKITERLRAPRKTLTEALSQRDGADHSKGLQEGTALPPMAVNAAPSGRTPALAGNGEKPASTPALRHSSAEEGASAKPR